MELVIDEEVIDSPQERGQQANEAALAGGIPVPDDKLVRVYIKIRDARTKLSKEYDAADALLKADLQRVGAELMRRLNERGSTQTKTTAGTAFFGEDMKVSIADEPLFRQFVLSTGDLDFYQKRVKVEHMTSWMKNNGGVLPPGISVFRERTINVRIPGKPRGSGKTEPDAFEDNNNPTGV